MSDWTEIKSNFSVNISASLCCKFTHAVFIAANNVSTCFFQKQQKTKFSKAFLLFMVLKTNRSLSVIHNVSQTLLLNKYNM